MWDLLIVYAQQHPRWFEPLARQSPAPELLAVYRQQVPTGWRLTRRGWWMVSHPPTGRLAEQGWKLHVASHPDNAAAVLEAALPVLFETGTSFKFLMDRSCVANTSDKRWARGSSGKFITVYPDSDERFVALSAALAKAVDNAADGPAAPYILSDRRVPGATNVYYRYGGFVGFPKVSADGTAVLCIKAPDGSLVPDIRHPYYDPPAWATDPFGEPELDPATPALCDGRFVVTGALAFTNAGGVYTATDQQTGDEVVIKEARPGVLVGRRLVDATETLAREYRLLSELADVPQFVTPIVLFHQGEHVFLAEERIVGAQLSQRGIGANPILTTDLRPDSLRDYYRQQRGWWLELADAISAAHERGILLADLSFTNALVRDADDRLALIDLEAAIQEGVDQATGLHTPGLASPRARRTGLPSRASDYYSLGAMILGSIMLVNGAVHHAPGLLPGFTAALAADLALPAGLVELVHDLLEPADAESDPDAAAIRRRIAELDFEGHPGWSTPVPLSVPAPAPTPGLRARIAEIVTGAVTTLHDSADVERTDRLFPSHPLLHETNPYSVAYGAAGTMHALHHLDTVRPKYTAWLLREDVDPGGPPGLYSGAAGVAWVLDEVGHPGPARRLLRDVLDRNGLGRDVDGDGPERDVLSVEAGILSGTAGVGMACLRLWLTGGRCDDDLLAAAVRCARRLAAEAVLAEHGPSWPVRAGQVEADTIVPIGYTRGASGIALFLLYLHLATGDAQWLTLGRSALGHDLAYTTVLRADDGTALYDTFPPLTPPPGEEPKLLKGYWEDGSAGVAAVLLRYLAVTGEAELRERWGRMRADVAHKYAIMPQLFHGLSGCGMTLLDAAELIGDERSLHEAWRVAEGVSLFAIDRADGITFGGEQNLRESMDLATGVAGMVLFLGRLGSVRTGSSPTNTNFLLDELLPTTEH